MPKLLRRKFIIRLFLVLGLVGIYFLPRLLAIKSFPMFNDEAIYIRWAQQGYDSAKFSFISLSDGKQPLYIWLVSLMMHVLPSPLAAGRIVSILTGLGTMFGLGTAAYLLFGKLNVAGLTMLLYALYPFAIVHDRMALYDSLLSLLYVWTINVSILFARKPSAGYAFLLANMMGAALLTKSTAILFFFLIPLTGIIESKNFRRKGAVKFVLYGLLILTFSFLYQSILYLSPDQEFVAAKNAIFTYPLSEVLTVRGIGIFFSNLWMFLGWIVRYLTLPIALVIVVSMCIKRLRSRQSLFLLFCFAIPFVLLAAVAKTVYPRHILFTTIPILILAADGIKTLFIYIKNVWVRWIVVLFFLSFVLYSDVMVVKNFARAPIPDIDRFQYINGPPAGGGIREIVSYIQQASASEQITVAAEGAFGSLPRTAMELYFFQSPNVHIVSFDENSKDVPKEIQESVYPVYIIFNKIQTLPDWPMVKVLEIPKGNGTYYMRLAKYL